MNAAQVADETEVEAPSEVRRPPRPRSRLTLDEVYGILSNRRRRIAVEFLRDTPETTLQALADHVAAVENDRPDGSFSPEERKRVYVSLYQSHLPKLAEAGVVVYDREANTVAAGGTLGQVLATLHPRRAGPPGGGLADLLSRLLPLRRW